jgi:8-oxo-dGTP diphosphatase
MIFAMAARATATEPVRRTVRVACAIVERGGHVLVAQRGPGMDRAGQWEFPGGKIHPRESPAACIAREIREELGLEVHPIRVGRPVRHRYADLSIELIPVVCRPAGGRLRLLEHRRIRWVGWTETNRLDWTAADIPLVTRYAARRCRSATGACAARSTV